MKAFIQLTSGEKQFLIATSAIVSISKSGNGSYITLNAAIDGFDPISKGAAFDVPFEDIVSRLASDTVELTKRGDNWGVVII